MKYTNSSACQTECLTSSMLFQDLGSKKVGADFTGGQVSSDGGSLLLQQVDRGLGISRILAGCFSDDRNAELVEHSVEELVRQRLFGLALGYEDLNDHAQLRRDPLLAAAVGKEDLLGKSGAPRRTGALPAQVPPHSTVWNWARSSATSTARSMPIPSKSRRRCSSWGCAVCPRTRNCSF